MCKSSSGTLLMILNHEHFSKYPKFTINPKWDENTASVCNNRKVTYRFSEWTQFIWLWNTSRLVNIFPQFGNVHAYEFVLMCLCLCLYKPSLVLKDLPQFSKLHEKNLKLWLNLCLFNLLTDLNETLQPGNGQEKSFFGRWTKLCCLSS